MFKSIIKKIKNNLLFDKVIKLKRYFFMSVCLPHCFCLFVCLSESLNVFACRPVCLSVYLNVFARMSVYLNVFARMTPYWNIDWLPVKASDYILCNLPFYMFAPYLSYYILFFVSLPIIFRLTASYFSSYFNLIKLQLYFLHIFFMFPSYFLQVFFIFSSCLINRRMPPFAWP